MKYVFHCTGHENIRAKHHKTIEFTKDTSLTPQGDCIVGLGADFDLAGVKRLEGRVKITVEVGGLQDTFWAFVNPGFDDDQEMVFRRSTFRSKRTLGIRLNKGAIALDRGIVQLMRDPTAEMKVTLEDAGATHSDRQAQQLGSRRTQ
jgi:hypothetical protein